MRLSGKDSIQQAPSTWHLAVGIRALAPEYPHHPAGHEHAAHKHDEAIQAIAYLVPRGVALRNTKHDRGEDREQ